MLIPLGTDRGVRRTPVVTTFLVVVTVVAYVAMMVLNQVDPRAHDRILETFWVIGGPEFRWWQPFTSTLLHSGLVHLIGNMIFLWVFGPPVEDRYGRLGFALLYVVGAYAAGGLHAVFERVWFEPAMAIDPEQVRAYAKELGMPADAAREMLNAAMQDLGRWMYVPAVGASGAIAAVTGAFLVMFPRTNIRALFLLGFAIVSVPAWWMIGLAIAWNLLSQSLGIDRGVAYLAHLGGYALGFGLTIVLLMARVFPREPYDLFTIFRQAHRRRQFRAASESAQTRPEIAAAQREEPAARAIDDLAERRARVVTLLTEGREKAAAEAYRELLSVHAHQPGAATLSRSAQYTLGAFLFREGRHEEAVEVFGRFVEAYPSDREAGAARVLIARMLGEHLGKPAQAREALEDILAGDADDDTKALAREELQSLGAPASEGDDADARP